MRVAGQVHRSYPRLVYLYDSLTPEVYDLTESKFNSVQLELKRADMRSAELDAQLAGLQQQNTELEEKQAHSRDDATIESIARERLGLVMPGEIVFYFISDRED